jgi:hypothetical protein
MRNPHAAEHDVIAVAECMNVVALADAHWSGERGEGRRENGTSAGAPGAGSRVDPEHIYAKRG